MDSLNSQLAIADDVALAGELRSMDLPTPCDAADMPLALSLAAQWDVYVAGRPAATLVRDTSAELRRLNTEVQQLRNLLTVGGADALTASEGKRIGQRAEIERLRMHVDTEQKRFEAARLAELRSLAWSSVPDRRAAARFARAVATRLWGKA